MLSIERAQEEGLRARNKREKVDRIERAARSLFGRKGFHSATTREIARKAGVGVGTLFVYFPEKSDLLLHLFVKDLGNVSSKALDGVPAKHSVADRLVHVFGAFFDYYAEHRELSRVFVKELMFTADRHRQELEAFTLGFLASVSALLDDAQRRGEIAATTAPEQLALFVFGDYYFALVCWLNGTFPNRKVALAQLRASIGQRLDDRTKEGTR